MIEQSYKREQVAQIIGSVVNRISSSKTADKALFDEMTGLKTLIDKMREELSLTRPGEIQSRIPSATDDLDAIVTTTEAATHTIMNSCETLQKMIEDWPLERSSPFENEIIRIVEACTFQDLTGQRIQKTIKFLKEINHRADEFWAIMKNRFADIDLVEEHQPQQSLMNGPQLPGQGISQADIDALLNDFA